MASGTRDKKSTNKNMHQLSMQTFINEFDNFWYGY